MINEGQNFSIGYPLQGGVEILEDQGEREERGDEDIIYENTPIESNSEIKINDFIRKPCIRNISDKHITFNNKVQICDITGKETTEKLSVDDRDTAVRPNFLPICRIYKL